MEYSIVIDNDGNICLILHTIQYNYLGYIYGIKYEYHHQMGFWSGKSSGENMLFNP